MGHEKFYILNTDGAFGKVAGEPVKIPIFEEFDFFLHRCGNDYRVSEGKTGNCISIGMSRKEAIENAALMLNQYGKEEVRRVIQEKIIKYGISPMHAPKLKGELSLVREKDAIA